MVYLPQSQQKTVGFLKPDGVDRSTELMALIKSNKYWKVTFELELKITLDQAILLYSNNAEDAAWISSLRATYGLDLVRNVCHASGSEKEAQHDFLWLQNLSILLDTTGPGSLLNSASQKPTSSKQSKYIKPVGVAATTRKHQSPNSRSAPVSETRKTTPLTKQPMTKRHPRSSLGAVSPATKSNQSTDSTETSSLRSTSKTQVKNSNAKRIESFGLTSKRVVSRYPGAVPLNRKRLSHMGSSNTTVDGSYKQKGAATSSSSIDDSQIIDEKDIKVEPTIEGNMNHPTQQTMPTTLANDNDIITPQATESIDTLSSSSSSQHTRESDYDKEVAATAVPSNSSATQFDSSLDPMDSSTMTRSKSPQVGNLKQRFEYLAKTQSLTTFTPRTNVALIKRNSSFTPEIAYCIKDLKPKNPAGSRVKSMVDFFMDENLHKWEF
ncbi:hypothetical protein BC941DRAFT_452486 [Chlamydoabsidia padenii]|nr:hypothetical protein BC941DRAFT_452486 [Chlamydoabsidia padenii]